MSSLFGGPHATDLAPPRDTLHGDLERAAHPGATARGRAAGENAVARRGAGRG